MSPPDGTTVSSSIEAHSSHSTDGVDDVKDLAKILADLESKYAHQPTFLQAVSEMALSIQDLLHENDFYRHAFAVMVEPERTVAFRVPWMDDRGKMQCNRGWRVEFSRYGVLYNVASCCYYYYTFLVPCSAHYKTNSLSLPPSIPLSTTIACSVL